MSRQRTLRAKVIYRLNQASVNMDRALKHIRFVDETCKGQSPFLDVAIPQLVLSMVNEQSYMRQIIKNMP
jgi:hypothetical protein